MKNNELTTQQINEIAFEESALSEEEVMEAQEEESELGTTKEEN